MARSGCGTCIIDCFIILIVAAVGVCLLLPPLDGDREPFDRMSCSSHLKRIAIALHNYHDTWRCFPPAITYDEELRPMHSWRVLILPYLEDPPTALIADYNMSEPWNGPNNSLLLEAMPEVFRCASAQFKERNSPDTYHTHFLAITSPGFSAEQPATTAWPRGSASSFRDILDGSSNTLMVVESITAKVSWMEPRDLRLEDIPIAINHPERVGMSSHHPGGCQVALVDGSVRFLGATISPGALRRLILSNDGERVGDY